MNISVRIRAYLRGGAFKASAPARRCVCVVLLALFAFALVAPMFLQAQSKTVTCPCCKGKTECMRHHQTAPATGSSAGWRATICTSDCGFALTPGDSRISPARWPDVVALRLPEVGLRLFDPAVRIIISS